MYDLRKIHDIEGRPYAKSASVPVFKYPGHVNTVTFRLGFDTSPDGSILACGTF